MERQPWQDPWQDLNFLRGKLALQQGKPITTPYCGNCGGNAVSDHDATCDTRGRFCSSWHAQDKSENRAIDPEFTEADKIAARGMGVIL